MQNNVQISGKWSKSKPKVDLQYANPYQHGPICRLPFF